MTQDVDCPIIPNRSHANLPQMDIALLHQTGPLLIDPRCRLPYYTRYTLGRQTPTNRPYPANQAQVYRALLHQRPSPPNQPQMEIALLHQ